MKHNWKRLGAMLLALAMVFSLVPTAALAARVEPDVALDAPAADADTAQTAEAPTGAEDGPAELLEVEPAGSGTVTDPTDSSMDYPLTADMFDFYSSRSAKATAGANLLNDNANSLWEAGYTGMCPVGTPEPQVQNTYIQISLPTAVKIQGLRYLTKTNETDHNGAFLGWKVMVATADTPQDSDFTLAGESTDDTKWTATEGWKLASVTSVSAKHIRLYSVSVLHGSEEKSGEAQVDCISCAGLRLMVAADEPSLKTITGTVTDGAGATVTLTPSGRTTTAGEGGAYTFNSVVPGTYTVSATTNPGDLHRASGTGSKEDVVVGSDNVTVAPFTLSYQGDTYHTTTNPLTAGEGNEVVSVGEMYVTAPSWHNPTHATEKAPSAALDGNHDVVWHSNYSNDGYGPDDLTGNNSQYRYLEISLDSSAWLTQLAYIPGQGGNGHVTKYDVKVSNAETAPTDAAAWTSVATNANGTEWVKDTSWHMVDFGAPIQAKHIRLYGVATGGANTDKFMTAAEVRMIRKSADPSAHDATITVTDASGTALHGATVVVAGRTLTTGQNGQVTVTLADDATYPVTASKTDYTVKEGTITGAANAALTLALSGPTTTVTGKVLAAEEGDGVDGVTVCLVTSDNNKTPLTNPEAVQTENGGEYSLNVSGVADGFYLVRAYAADRGAVIDTAHVVTVASGTATAYNTEHDLVLPPLPENPYQSFDFSSDCGGFQAAGSTTATVDNGQMSIQFASCGQNLMPNSAVMNKTFVMKNGTVEFDITRTSEGTDAKRFGLVLQRYDMGGNRDQEAVNKNSIRVGFFGNYSNYGAQWWIDGNNQNTAWDDGAHPGPAMERNVTRHMKVSIEGGSPTENGTLQVWVDGIRVLNNASVHTGQAGYIGFEAMSGSYLIDNLRVYRTDGTGTVTLDNGSSGGTLAAKIVTPDFEGAELTSSGTAYAGDTIKITGSKAGQLLASVTGVDAANITTVEQSDGTWAFTFPMPASNVTVTGIYANAVGDVTVDGAYAGDNVTIPGTDPVQPYPDHYVREGKELTASAAATTNPNYQWQKSTDNGSTWTDIAGATNAAYTPTDYNSETPTLIRVKVSGNGTDNAGFKYSTEYTLQPEVVELGDDSLSFTRFNGVTMWLNDSTKGDTGNIVGKTTVATPVISGNPTTPLTVRWESSDSSTVSVTPIANTTTATLTALKAGSATVTVKMRAKDGTVDKFATLNVTVMAKLESLAVKQGGSEVDYNTPIVIYANTDAELAALSNAGITGLINKLDLTAERNPGENEPDGNTDALIWTVSEKPSGVEGDPLSVDYTSDQNTLTASVKLNADLTADTISSEQFVGKLGNYKVKVSNGNGVEKEVTVQLRRYVNRPISITISGVDAAGAAPKYEQTLSANVNQLAMSEAGKAALKFEWFALDASATELPNGATPFKTITGAETLDGSFRTLQLKNDNKDASYSETLQLVGKKIAVRISATPGGTNFYEGSKVAIREQAVVKADGPAIPSDSTIHGVQGESLDQPNGKIAGFPTNDGNTYEYKLVGTEDIDANWTTVSGSEATNVAPGKYEVRIKATDTHKAGASRNVTVGTWDSNLFTVELGTLSNGAITRDPTQAEAGATVTLTVKPATGYELVAGFLTVTPVTSSGNGTALELIPGTADTDGNATYTFTIPANFTDPTAEKVTVNASFQKIKLTIDHSGLDKITCKQGSSSHSHQVDYGTEAAITLVPAEGYTLPASTGITVYNNDDPQNRVVLEGWTLSDANTAGERTITFPVNNEVGGVVHNLYIEATGVAKTYTVTHGTTTALSYSNSGNATHNTEYQTTLSVIEAQKLYYTLPDTIEVKRGATVLTEGASGDYTYNKTSGDIVIKAAAVTGPLTINARGEEIKYAISAVSITISHTDDDYSASTTPHVGDSLQAKVTTNAPQGVSVTADYAWYREGVTDPISTTGSTYQLQEADEGKTITVKVTGKDHFTTADDQPVTATTQNAVEAAIVRVTGVSLNKTTLTLEWGAEETLNATVAPATASNNNVSWGSGNEAVATVDANGKVTAVKPGTATITVKTADGNKTAQCTVTVSKKDLPALGFTATPQVGKNATVSFGSVDVGNVTYAWSTSASADGTFSPLTGVTGTTWPNDTDGIHGTYANSYVKVTATTTDSNEYYMGSSATQATKILAGDVQTYTVSVTDAENGSVTASPATAAQGTEITLTIEPASGYQLKSISVKDANETAVTVTGEGDTRTFEMPASNVTVIAEFEQIPVTPTTYAITTTKTGNGTVTVKVGNAEVTEAAENDPVVIEVTDVAQGATVAVTSTTEGVTLTKGTGNTWSFTMPANAVAISVTITDPVTPPEVNKDALTAAIKTAEDTLKAANVINKPETDVPAGTEYYKKADADILQTAIDAAKAVLNKADASQEEVNGAVTALTTAVDTFKGAELTGTLDLTPLKNAIAAAKAAKAAVNVKPDGTTEEQVHIGEKFVTESDMATFDEAIAAAEAVLAAPTGADAVTQAVTALTGATTTFTGNTITKTGTSEDVPATEVNTTELDTAIADAEAAAKTATVASDAAQVNKGSKYVTAEEMKALTDAIEAAKAVKADPKTDGNVANAVDALNAAVETFNAAKKDGTKQQSSSSGSSGSRPTTTVETKPDGTKVTTVTQPDGTKTETTEKPDGSKEVVETKKDGTVTETKTDAEGAKTEKVTAPDKSVTITVTDKDGEELAKVELPAQIAPLPEDDKFVDLAPTPWAEESINNVASLKLVEGVGDKKYAPTESMTRGQLATVLHRMSQGKTDYEVTFQDVANDKYYTQGVAWAAKAGVVKGFSEDIFAPDQVITREQLAVMLTRYAKLIGLDTAADAEALNAFADSEKTSDWAVDSLAWCVKSGILQGKGGSVLDPTANVSRAEAAAMLDRFISLMK